MSVSKERDSNVTPFLTYVGLIFCIINLALFYLWLLPNIGKSISEKCLSVWTCSRFLKKTWVGYTIDVADGQWRELRGNLWLLWICLIFTIVVKILLNYSTNRESITIAEIEYEKLGEKRFILQRIFRLIFACCFLAVQHKYHSLIIVTISILAFLLSKLLKGSKSSVYIIWVFGLLILFFKESYRIKNYPNFSFLQPLFDRRYGGIYKWQLPANFLILRLISFCLDYHRAFVYHEKKNAENEGDKIAVHYLGKPQEEETVAATKSDSTNKTSECLDSKVNNKRHFRDIIHLQLSDYNLLNFSVYAIYAPLYMAGPIITFNDFVTSSKNFKDQKLFPAFYLVRWLLCFAFMEFLSHQFPLFAVVNSGLFSQLTVSEIAGASYIILKLMWMKFLLIWRFFRLWSIADGIAAPENMLRCMSNNYSLEQFWKGWHSSFNKWIVRYLYLPFGGRDNRIFSVWPVFLFVAVWHDIESKVFIWGGLNAVFFMIEILAKRSTRTKFFQRLPPSLTHLITVLSGALYILVLISVNLVGYAVGVAEISSIYEKFMSWEGLRVLMISCYICTIGTGFMMYIDERNNQEKIIYDEVVIDHGNKGE